MNGSWTRGFDTCQRVWTLVQRRRSRSCGGSAHYFVGKKKERRERQEKGRFFSFKLCVPRGKSFFYLLEVAMKKRCHPPVFSCGLSVPGRSDVQSDPAVQRIERLLRVHRSSENASDDRAGERTPPVRCLPVTVRVREHLTRCPGDVVA